MIRKKQSSPFRRFLRQTILGRLALRDSPFAILAIVVFMLVTTVLLGISKIWRTTPKGVYPMVKVSVIDLLQARNLRRGALKAEAEGRFDDAIGGWMGASANNKGDTRLLRETLQAFNSRPVDETYRGQAVEAAFWLLKLGNTNDQDLDLSLNVLEHVRLHPLMMSLMDERGAKLPKSLEPAKLRCLFELHRYEAFRACWAQCSEQTKADPVTRLHEAVVAAGVERSRPAGEVFELLAKAGKDPKTSRLWAHLSLTLADRLGDLPRCTEAAMALRGAGEATLQDQILWWRLMARAGNAGEAVWWLMDNRQESAIPSETISLLLTAQDLGHPRLGMDLAERRWQENAFQERFWVVYSDLAVAAKEWDRLPELAYRIRLIPGLKDRIAGFAEYLIAKGMFEANHRKSAEDHFARIAPQNIADPNIAFSVARSLVQMGRWEDATRMVRATRAPEGDEAAFHELSLACAARLRDSAWLLSTSAQALKLKPEDPGLLTTFIAASIVERTNTAEVLRLTLEMLDKDPTSLSTTLNRASGLLLGQRPAEALQILRQIDPDTLKSTEKSSYYFDFVDGLLALNQPEAAAMQIHKIDENQLFPQEQKRLLEWRRKLVPLTSPNNTGNSDKISAL